MKIKLIAIFITSFLLISCASGPSLKEMELATQGFELESLSEGDNIDIYIYYYHADGKRMVFSDITYYLDGSSEPVGVVGFKEYIRIRTTPGEHKIRWEATGKKGSLFSRAETINLEKGETYIFRQVHDIIFNRYSKDGLSVISSLNQADNLTQGKYYMRDTKKRK